MKKKYYKEINTMPFNFIFENSPIEFIDAVNYYDIETFDYSLVIRMKNVSGEKIKGAKLLIHLFLDNNVVPYKKMEITYDFKKDKTDILGANLHIPIPESFYKSFEIVLTEVTFSDGRKEKYNFSSRKKSELIKDQTLSTITACELVEESETLHESYPAIAMPKFGENAWICSCSHKNSTASEACEKCGRSKQWLIETYDAKNLEIVAAEGSEGTLTMTRRAEKARFIEKRDYKPTDEAKEFVIEKEIKKVEKREKYKDKMRIQALPRIALYFILAYLLYFLLRLLMETVLK